MVDSNGVVTDLAAGPRPQLALPRGPERLALPAPPERLALPPGPSAGGGGARFVVDGQGGVTDLVGSDFDRIVLGHYPEYVELAQRTGARTFSMSDEAWSSMSPDEQWLRNQRFLDRAIERGDEISLATPVDRVRPGSFYERELQYLGKHGYVPSEDGGSMVRP